MDFETEYPRIFRTYQWSEKHQFFYRENPKGALAAYDSGDKHYRLDRVIEKDADGTEGYEGWYITEDFSAFKKKGGRSISSASSGDSGLSVNSEMSEGTRETYRGRLRAFADSFVKPPEGSDSPPTVKVHNGISPTGRASVVLGPTKQGQLRGVINMSRLKFRVFFSPHPGFGRQKDKLVSMGLYRTPRRKISVEELRDKFAGDLERYANLDPGKYRAASCGVVMGRRGHFRILAVYREEMGFDEKIKAATDLDTFTLYCSKTLNKGARLLPSLARGRRGGRTRRQRRAKSQKGSGNRGGGTRGRARGRGRRGGR